jgi:hypothetical protein
MGRIVAVSGKPVQLPNNHCIKQFLITVLDHALKFGAVVGLCGKGAVYVGSKYGYTVLFGKFFAFADLPVDAFLALAVGGIAGVDNRIDGFLWFYRLVFISCRPPTFSI